MIAALSAVLLNSFDYLLLIANELKAFIYDKEVETRKNWRFEVIIIHQRKVFLCIIWSSFLCPSIGTNYS